MEGTKRRRSEVTPERLRAVAARYLAAADTKKGGSHKAGVLAVKTYARVGRSQAYRLVDQARDAGFITDHPQPEGTMTMTDTKAGRRPKGGGGIRNRGPSASRAGSRT